MVRKRLFGFLAVASVSLAFVGTAPAEDQPGAELLEQAAVQPQFGGNRQPTAAEMQQLMGPMMGEMMSGMLKAMSKTMAEPQIAQNFATFTRNYYQALTDRGFSEEEALKIVTSSGLPSMGGGK